MKTKTKVVLFGISVLFGLDAAFPADTGVPGTQAKNPSIDDLVYEAAQKHNLPSVIVRSLIDVESGWNPHAIGFNGGGVETADHGLMQINMRTAKARGVNDWVKLHTDIPLNIELGTRELAEDRDWAEKQTKNKWDMWTLAVARYNAGPTNWRKGLPHAEKVISIVKKELGDMNL